VRTALRLGGALAALAVALSTSPVQAAGRDPQMMTHAEWASVKAGMTRSKVNSVCGCTGVLWLDLRPADSVLLYHYLAAGADHAEVDFRFSNGAWRAADFTLWCPTPQGACQVKNI
jgi:hypothetical protein